MENFKTVVVIIAFVIIAIVAIYALTKEQKCIIKVAGLIIAGIVVLAIVVLATIGAPILAFFSL
jgi:hypothetical protein